MSGIYIHIPFCKQACHYCDFHFSTGTKHRAAMVTALQMELELRKQELQGPANTLYFGGGTPSVLDGEELTAIIQNVRQLYPLTATAEITVEANPDDISEAKLQAWATAGVNRLSIGVQSFFEEDLKIMNRAHNAAEAMACLELAQRYFTNITIDLIYGMPQMDMDRWQQNLDRALGFNIPHISSYALTVEPRTALHKMVATGAVVLPDEGMVEQQFQQLCSTLENEGFVHYEISNFGKPGHFSQNNTAYWQGKTYLGIGPSAHSFNGTQRSWNVANNAQYLTAINSGQLPREVELLSLQDRFNERIMTGLRTIWGVPLSEVAQHYGQPYLDHLQKESRPFLEQGLLQLQNGVLSTTQKGKFLVDGIASDLFMVN